MARLPTITELTARLSARGGRLSYETTVTAGPGYDATRNLVATLAKGLSALSVGIHDDAGIHHEASKDGKVKTVAEVAFWNEFGTDDGHIPERSFMRSTMDRNMFRYQGMLKKYAIRIYEGRMTIDESLDQLGRIIAADMRKAVRDFHDPRNADSTIKAKGFDDPLIETRQLMRSITHKRTED
jgi:hypothetical protein